MCEYCEGRKLLTHTDNEDELGSYCGVVSGTHKRLTMGIHGRHVYVNGRVHHMSAEDCYYTAELDDDDNLGFSSGMYEEVQIKYCPMCGRRLDGQAVAWADAEDAEANIANLEGLLLDIDPTVMLCMADGNITVLYVTLYGSIKEFKKIRAHEKRLSNKLRTSYKSNPTGPRYPELDILSSDLKEFPAGEFLEAGSKFNMAWHKRMRITPAGLRQVLGHCNAHLTYQKEVVELTEELIAGYEAFVQGIHDRIAELKTKAEAFRALAAKEGGATADDTDHARVVNLISGFFTTHQWNAYYEQDYIKGTLGPEPGLNTERLRTDIEAYVARAGAK